MTAAELISQELEPLPAISSKTKPIIVATDGTDTSLPAFKVADIIRARSGCTVRVVSALEPLPAMLPLESMVIPPDWEEVREKGQRKMVTEQLRSFKSSADWVVDVVFGKPCEAISSYAREHNGGLIIVGSNKHGMIGRLLGDDTAADIAVMSEVPLLIATSEMTRLPKRVIVAMGLNPDGMQITAEVLSLIADTPSISCVHVKPRDEFLGVDWAQYDSDYDLAMNERFKDVERAFSGAGMRPDLITLHGNTVKELTDFAEYSKAELIVVGIARKAGKVRAIRGRIARRTVREATCSVLIVPNFVPLKPGVVSPGETDVIRDSRCWDSAMREFTKRNAGRLVNLEVDDPEIGAIVEAKNYPLIGVDYDHRDDCFSIIIGDVRGIERHLTRTIAKPKSVAILSGDGRDAALSIAHNGGQTLLTF